MAETAEPDLGPSFGGFRYSADRRCLVDRDGREVALRPHPLAVFRALAARPDTVLDRDTLLGEVWGAVVVTEDSLQKCVAEIRRAIGDERREVLRIPRVSRAFAPP